jgi:hypothetical protein
MFFSAGEELADWAQQKREFSQTIAELIQLIFFPQDCLLHPRCQLFLLPSDKICDLVERFSSSAAF